jgi:elongator complex protein 1
VDGEILTRQTYLRGNYRDAFIDCRKHRIDLNLLVDHDHTSFMSNIPSFIEQVHEVDYINLFLAGIG